MKTGRDRDKSSQCCIQKGATTRAENKVFARCSSRLLCHKLQTHTCTQRQLECQTLNCQKLLAQCVCVVCASPDTPSHYLRESHAVVSAVDSCIDTRQFNIDANFEAPTRRWHQQAGTKSAIKSAFKGSSPQAQAAAAAALNVPRGGAQRTNCPQMSSSRALGLSVKEERGNGSNGVHSVLQSTAVVCAFVHRLLRVYAT